MLLLPARKSEISQLREEVSLLRSEVNALSQQVAMLLNAPRPNWRRPAFDDLDIPPAQLAQETDPEIARVTFDKNQFVRAYRANGCPIPQWCGPFEKIGLALLARTGKLEWVPIDCPPGHPLVFPDLPELPTTPVPALPQLI